MTEQKQGVTPELIADLRAKLAASPHRPWDHQPWGGQNQNGDYMGGDVFDDGGEYVLSDATDADGALIVAAVNALPALLDEIERLRAALAALDESPTEREALCDTEHPVTGRLCSLPEGHEPGHICERETPADEWEYRARWDRDDSLWFGVSADRVGEWAAKEYEVQRRCKAGPWEPVPEEGSPDVPA